MYLLTLTLTLFVYECDSIMIPSPKSGNEELKPKDSQPAGKEGTKTQNHEAHTRCGFFELFKYLSVRFAITEPDG